MRFLARLGMLWGRWERFPKRKNLAPVKGVPDLIFIYYFNETKISS